MGADCIYHLIDPFQLFLHLRIQDKRLLPPLSVETKLPHGFNTPFAKLQEIVRQLHPGSFLAAATFLDLPDHQHFSPFTGHIHHVITDNDSSMFPRITFTTYAAPYSQAIIKLIHGKTPADEPCLTGTNTEALHQMAAKAMFFRICGICGTHRSFFISFFQGQCPLSLGGAFFANQKSPLLQTFFPRYSGPSF